ncbi:MAG: hypothetical protein WCC00_14560, partial [Candidatus Aminicenantales bacterium]
EKQDEGLEQRAREKKEEFKPAPKKEAKKEEPKFGIFADLLKTALKKKPEDQEAGGEKGPEEKASKEKPEGEEPK